MIQSRRCPYCQSSFLPSAYCAQQSVCSRPECQRRRRSDYHRKKLATDTEYFQVVRDSQKQWWDEHPGYQKQHSQQNLVSHSVSFRCSHDKISSIFPSTNTARRRLNFGGMGGFLVIKFVKPTKIVCSRTPHESGVGQNLLSQTKPNIRTAAARVLGKTDAAVRQKVCRLDPADCALYQITELLTLLLVRRY